MAAIGTLYVTMVVKAVHVCQVESELAVGHKTAGQHSQSHDTDTCKICHFAFSIT